jgi:hypothetical protein
LKTTPAPAASIVPVTAAVNVAGENPGHPFLFQNNECPGSSLLHDPEDILDSRENVLLEREDNLKG